MTWRNFHILFIFFSKNESRIRKFITYTLHNGEIETWAISLLVFTPNKLTDSVTRASSHPWRSASFPPRLNHFPPRTRTKLKGRVHVHNFRQSPIDAFCVFEITPMKLFRQLCAKLTLRGGSKYTHWKYRNISQPGQNFLIRNFHESVFARRIFSPTEDKLAPIIFHSLFKLRNIPTPIRRAHFIFPATSQTSRPLPVFALFQLRKKQ